MNTLGKRCEQPDDLLALIAELKQQYMPAEEMCCPKCGGKVFRFQLGYDGDEKWMIRCVAGNSCDFESPARPEDQRIVRLCESFRRPLTGCQE
jgi:hypothetical protein